MPEDTALRLPRGEGEPARSEYDAGSFRDRDARVFEHGGAIYRALSPRALADHEALERSKLFARLTAEGKLVATSRAEPPPPVPGGATWAAVLRHERVPFLSYPYEWTFGMLKEAARLSLELLLAALDEDLVLKDASAYNVQFTGSAPVFIDVASFARLAPGEPWAGYQQFCQQFLYPLMLQAYKGAPFQPWLRGSVDGIDPEAFASLLSFRDLFRPGALLHGWLLARAKRRMASTTRDVRADLRRAGFSKALIQANVRGLAKLVEKLRWAPEGSQWADYAQERAHYSAEDRDAKAAFVRAACAEKRRGLVWDVGANTGEYSRIAAEHAGHVVALDADALAVERLWQQLRARNDRRILPLVMNLADASPGLGWRGRERKAVDGRGRPDLVLALAVIHHLVLGANLPMDDVLEWLAGLGGELVIEFVGRADPMVQKLLRNRVDIFDDYAPDRFEAALARFFEPVAKRELAGGRTLYHARSRRRTP